MVFCPITQEQLTKIRGIGKPATNHFPSCTSRTPGQLRGVLHREFSYRIKDKLRQIGLWREFVNIGGATLQNSR
ncbi:hypothetical protein L873DRAFT_1805936, partial [Choiromyces venosus 120613-1]